MKENKLDEIIKEAEFYNSIYTVSMDEIGELEDIAIDGLVYDEALVDSDQMDEKVIEPLYKNQVRKLVNEMLECLSETDRKILEMKYGINREREYTEKEIAKETGLPSGFVNARKELSLVKVKSKYKEKLRSFQENN